MGQERSQRAWSIWVLVGLAVVLFGSLPARAEAIECWRGWAYRVDPETRAYKSAELLLVTKGPADWQVGLPVVLHQLDRATGAIAAREAPLTVIPASARTYYRGRANYVDGRGAIVGTSDELVFGLSHIAAPSAALEKMHAYNRWACGLGATG